MGRRPGPSSAPTPPASASGKAERGGDDTGRNPTDRGKLGVKKHVLTDAKGYPLSIVLSGANRHDSKVLKAVLDGVIIPMPLIFQHLCLDKGYSGKPCRKVVEEAGYIGHIRQIGEEKKTSSHTPRRWVVERTHAWFNKYRCLRVRYERKSVNYLGMLEFAAAIMWWRRLAAG